MKICLIYLEYYNECGGAGIVTRNLGVELAQLGHEVHIIALSKGAETTHCPSANVYIHELYYPVNHSDNGFSGRIHTFLGRIQHFIDIYSKIRIIHPDILHSQGSTPALMCYMYKLFHHIPYCVCFHSDPTLYVSPLIASLLLKYGKHLPHVCNADLLFSVSLPLRFTYQRIYEKAVCFIPNGAAINIFKPSYLVKPDIKKNPKIICVSRMVHDKGLEDAITAMADVVVRYPDSELILIGDGVLRSELEIQVSSLSLEKNVTFTGFIPNGEVVAYYQKAHIYLLPSWNEGFPIVLFEAMGCGLPIVSTRVGSIPDVLTERNGYIIPIKQPREIASALCKIISLSPQEYEQISLENISVARQNSWAAIAKCYENEYQKVLHNKL